MDDANFKLSALFSIQEFHPKKGSPDEHSTEMEPFMNRMGISPKDIFGAGKQEPQFTPIPEQAFGGLVKADKGLETDGRDPGEGLDYEIKDSYSKAGLDRLNRLRVASGLSAIDEKYIGNKSYIDKAAGQLQDAFAKQPELLSDYMLNSDSNAGKSDRPNNKMQRSLFQQGFVPSNGKDFTNADLQNLHKDGQIDNNFLASNYADDLWTYRGAYSNVKDLSKPEFEAIQNDPNNKWITGNDGVKYRWMGEDLYEGYRMKEDGTYERIQPDAKVIDDPYKWNVDHIKEGDLQRNMDFRWDHKRALAQAVKNKSRIPRLTPFTTTPDVQFVDQAYYNPDQMISAVESMVQGQGQKQAMHAGPQGQLSNFLAGQQFDVMSKVIGDYEDKNVQAYNTESLTNTNIANVANDRLASAIQDHHDKTTILKQEYSNARNAADNNIAENEIAMWTERKNRMNLEATIGEQFATDPNTGLHKFVKGKDFTDTNGNAKTIADTFADLKHRLPGVADAELTKMAMGIHSGKYEIQNFGQVAPNEQNFQN
jgi:hypothetical protein